MDFTRPFPGKNPGDKITKQELISAIRLSLCAEEEATHLYDSIAEYTDDERVKKIMKDVADEEQVHIGEFQKLLDILEEDEVEKVEEGEEEAEEKMDNEKPVEEGFNPQSLSKYVTEDPDVVSEDVQARSHVEFDIGDVGDLLRVMGLDKGMDPGADWYDLELFKKAIQRIDPSAIAHERGGKYVVSWDPSNLYITDQFLEKIEELGLGVSGR